VNAFTAPQRALQTRQKPKRWIPEGAAHFRNELLVVMPDSIRHPVAHVNVHQPAVSSGEFRSRRFANAWPQSSREENKQMSEASMWIIPEAPAPTGGALQRERQSEGRGLRLGVLDNAKSNADHLLAMIIEGVQATLPVTSVVRLRKPSSAAGAEREILDELAENADCVISAMAD
jgi:hypothetical protein